MNLANAHEKKKHINGKKNNNVYLCSGLSGGYTCECVDCLKKLNLHIAFTHILWPLLIKIVEINWNRSEELMSSSQLHMDSNEITRFFAI